MKKLSALAVALALFAGVFASIGTASAASTWYVSTVGIPTSSPGGSCATPSFNTITLAVNAASNGDSIRVCTGTYAESVAVSKTLTLIGAKAGTPVSARPTSAGESIVVGTTPAVFTVSSPNVVIRGFWVTNPLQSTGILVKTGGSGSTIVNNVVDNIGGVGFAGNTQGIYLEYGPDNVRVLANRISKVQGIATSNGGIYIGDSTSADPSLNILIQGNTITDITSTRGASAIHINNGSSSAPTAIGYTTVRIIGNTANNLTGGWVHAIGIEGDAPGAVVRCNSIAGLNSASPDEVAVWFEDDPSFNTARVNSNNFNVTAAEYGIAVHPALVTANPSGRVDGRNNWWGNPTGPGPVGTGTGAKVGPGVTFTPWLRSQADCRDDNNGNDDNGQHGNDNGQHGNNDGRGGRDD